MTRRTRLLTVLLVGAIASAVAAQDKGGLDLYGPYDVVPGWLKTVEEGYLLSVRTVYGRRTARATTNKFDPESLRRVVAESASLARQQQPDPELLPMPGPQEYPRVERSVDATAAVSAPGESFP